MPKKYFDSFTEIFAVPDLTCDQKNRTTIAGRLITYYQCTCYGSNYNGMPAIEI